MVLGDTKFSPRRENYCERKSLGFRSPCNFTSGLPVSTSVIRQQSPKPAVETCRAPAEPIVFLLGVEPTENALTSDPNLPELDRYPRAPEHTWSLRTHRCYCEPKRRAILRTTSRSIFLGAESAVRTLEHVSRCSSAFGLDSCAHGIALPM